jgi:hypothetical protein
MGRVCGDKSRFNKHRKKKLARRVAMRALGKELRANAAATKAAPARKEKRARKEAAT